MKDKIYKKKLDSRLMILVDWLPEEGEFPYLQERYKEINILGSHMPKGATGGWQKILFRWPGYFWVSLKALIKAEKYDFVIAHQPVCGIMLALLLRIFLIKSTKLIVLNFIFTQKTQRISYELRWWLTKVCLKKIDWLSVYTKKEVDTISELFSYPKENIYCIPQGIIADNNQNSVLSATNSKEYIFSSGMSLRDYKTLFNAFKEIDYKLVVVCQEHNIKRLTIPDNVKVYLDIWGDEVKKLRRESKFVIVPLLDENVSAGQYDILFSMADRKAIIATDTVASLEHLTDGHDGILVKRGNYIQLRDKIKYLIDNQNEIQRLGENAYKTFKDNFTFDVYQHGVDKLISDILLITVCH